MSTESNAPSRGMLELLLGGLSALGPLSIDMYLPALPAIAVELGSDQADSSPSRRTSPGSRWASSSSVPRSIGSDASDRCCSG